MASFGYAPPNIGFEVTLSDYEQTPTTGDKVGDVASISNIGVTVNSVPVVPITSKEGVERPTPTTKAISPMTLVVYEKDDGSTLTKFMSRVSKNVTEPEFLCTLGIFYPTGVGHIYDGFISSVNPGDADSGQVRTVSIVFSPFGFPRMGTKPSGDGEGV